MVIRPCDHCGSARYRPVILNLGRQPLANAYRERADGGDLVYPLAVDKCEACHLVQLVDRVPSELLFTEGYPFRQGVSETWREHLIDLVEEMMQGYQPIQTAMDVGANDGTLVGIMADHGIAAWGVDPAPQGPFVIRGAMGHGFAASWLDAGGPRVDWIAANNVLAHVLDLDDFLSGIKSLLSDHGHLTVEVPDWYASTWDQVYHEHLRYFTDFTLVKVLAGRGFVVERVLTLPTHGGSLRAVCRHA